MNKWHWISGNDTSNQPGIYSNNTHGLIGSRYMHAMVKLTNSSLLIFGGYGYDRSVIGKNYLFNY